MKNEFGILTLAHLTSYVVHRLIHYKVFRFLVYLTNKYNSVLYESGKDEYHADHFK